MSKGGKGQVVRQWGPFMTGKGIQSRQSAVWKTIGYLLTVVVSEEGPYAGQTLA